MSEEEAKGNPLLPIVSSLLLTFQCDGRVPVCGPCEAVGTTCVPSDRLVILSETDCGCEQLRAQVRDLEEQNRVLRAQLLSSQPVNHATVQSSSSEGGHGASRMLLPTFPRLAPSESGSTTFLSSPWRLWDGLIANETSDTEPDNIRLSDAERVELVDIFFIRRWPQYPVLHKPTFVQSHYFPWASGEPCSSLSTFLVNIVLAIGASEKGRATPSSQTLHQHFFRAAIEKLDDVLGADDRDGIQCLLLLCMYGSHEPQSVNLWYTAGLALRLAIGTNMHRCESVGNGALLEEEMAKRLFWSVYTMDRSICIAMGRPLGIQDSDITMPFPSCLTDDMLVQGDALVAPSLTPDPRDMSTFLHIIRLRRLNADIYKTLHSAGQTTLTANLETIRSQFYGQLNQWLVSAPRYISPACMNQTSEWFQIAFHQAVMNLYRPSPTALPGTVSLDALRLCADSAISLIINYSALYAKNRITYSFVALTSLFMAAVTMLYSLRASAVLRAELTRSVVESNIGVCGRLLRSMANGRAVGDRSATILQRLGTATLAMFDAAEPETEAGDVDTEFMSWFGLKSQHSDQGQPTPSVDVAWNDLFDTGFDSFSLFNDMPL